MDCLPDNYSAGLASVWQEEGVRHCSLTTLVCIPLDLSFRGLRRGADNLGNAVEEVVVFCWKEATAAREKPKAERRGGEEARLNNVENSLTFATEIL